MELYDRPLYLNRLKKWRDHDMIKVVTGVRRAGKSTLLEIYRNWLEESGVSRDRMVAINFEDPDVPEFSNWREAWNYLKPLLADRGRTCVFLDEIQRVPEFEKLVDGLHSRKTMDIYITGPHALSLGGDPTLVADYLDGIYNIKDNYPKTLVTLDEDPPLDIDGIRQVNTYDFLLNGDS